MLGERTKLVAITHVSNALGTINPIETIVGLAKGTTRRCWWTAPRPCPT